MRPFYLNTAMKKPLNKILIGLIAAGIIIQFIPITLPENNPDLSADLLQTQTVPADVSAILKMTCYDCHSSQTVYPWYSHVAPVSWLVAKDVREGREELNMSEWGTLSKRKQIKTLNDIAEVVEQKEMPMKIYTLIHRDAILDDADITTLISWTSARAEELLGGSGEGAAENSKSEEEDEAGSEEE